MKRRVAILISGRGSNMAALIQAAAAEHFPAHIVVVVSNRADAGGLETAKASGVPTVTIESKPFGKDRAAFEADFRAAVDRDQDAVVCLAWLHVPFTARNRCTRGGRLVHHHLS